jgi:hypothetical protein
VWREPSLEIRVLGLGAGAARLELSGIANRSRSAELLATGVSVQGERQSVKLIVLIILIEYDYRVVSNPGTKLCSTAPGKLLPWC